jgi:hypothetical protein
MEEIKPRGRPRKPRVGILSAEQVLALQTPQQIATAEARERERQRGIARRAEKKVLDSMSEAEDIQQFWAESLKLADAQKLAEWRERQECVLDTMHWMESWMSGTYNVSPSETEYYVGIEEGDEDLRRDIAEHGECGATPILWVGKFWQDPNLLAQLTSGETPSAIFAKFGILTALPDLRVHQWEQFMAARRATQKAKENATVLATVSPTTTMKCSCADKRFNTESTGVGAQRSQRRRRVDGWPRLNSEKWLGAASLRFSSGAEDTAGGAGGLGREEQEGGAAARADGVGGGRNSGEFFLEGRVFGSAQ